MYGTRHYWHTSADRVFNRCQGFVQTPGRVVENNSAKYYIIPIKYCEYFNILIIP